MFGYQIRNNPELINLIFKTKVPKNVFDELFTTPGSGQ